jgi:hypothetical protein
MSSVVTILRRSVAAAANIDTDASEARKLAEAFRCSAVRVLKSIGERRDIFVITDWQEKTAAETYMSHFTAWDATLSQSPDGLELRAPSGEFHLALLAPVAPNSIDLNSS